MEQTKCAARTLFDMRVCGVTLGLVGLVLMPVLASAATTPELSSALKAEIESNYGKLPLSFKANQWPDGFAGEVSCPRARFGMRLFYSLPPIHGRHLNLIRN